MTKYIERERVLEQIRNFTEEEYFSVDYYIRGWNEAVTYILNYITKDIPPADVQEVKQGKWEEKRLVSGEIKYTCSKCGQVFQGESLDFNYCPNCGAKMDGNNSDTM